MPLARGVGWTARFYDRLMAPIEKRTLSRWRRRLWSKLPAGGTGLEIGAGTGTSFRYYPTGSAVVASDVSHGMLLRAARRPDRDRTPLLACDVERLPFRDASFDWAAAALVFCEVPDPVAGLREVRRVLRPSGRLVLMEHVRPAGWRGFLADGATKITSPLWGEHFDRDTEGAARAAGLLVVEREWLWGDAVVLLVAEAH